MAFFDFEQLLKNFVPQIGIDLGTSNTPIFLRGKGIIGTEPSYVALDNETNKVIAVGETAKQMYGRAPSNISVIRPLRDGVIANFEVAYEMLRNLLLKAVSNRNLIKPRIIIGVPADCTPVERRAVEEAAIHAGGRNVVIVPQPLLAAIGSELPVKEAVGSMMVDIGGGTTELAIVSLGGMVLGESLRVAGDKMDEAIITYIKRIYNLLIGERTAEAVKVQIGSVYPQKEEKYLEIRGRDIFSGLPRIQKISSSDIRESLMEPVGTILEAIRSALERSPPELVSDIMENGIVIAGGGSLLEGFPQLVQEAAGVKCRRPADPVYCVALGAGLLFNDPPFLRQITNYRDGYWEHPSEVG